MIEPLKNYRLISREYIRRLAGLLATKEKLTIVPSNHWAVNLESKTLYYDENSLRKYNETHVLGFMLHEIGHIKYTDEIDTDTAIVKKHPSISREYMNGLEDMRIDHIMSQKYAGSMEVMEAMHEQATVYAIDTITNRKDIEKKIDALVKKAELDSKNTTLEKSDRDNAKRAKSALEEFKQINDVQMMLFSAMIIYYRFLSESTSKEILESLKEELREPTKKMVDAIDQSGIEFMDNTAEVQDFYEKVIFPIIEPFIPPEENQESKRQQQSQNFAGQGKKNLSDASGKGAKPQPSDDPNNSGETEDEYDEDGMPKQKQRLAKAGADKDARDTTRAKEVQENFAKVMPGTKALVDDADASNSVGNSDGGSDDSDYAAARAQIRTEVSNLVARVNRILRDNSFERYEGKNRSGRLRKSGLYRFMANDNRLFQKKTGIQNKSYAFSVMIDASGSMQGYQWDESLKAVALLTDACAKMKVPCEIIAFSNQNVTAKPFHQSIDPTIFNRTVAPILFGGTSLSPAFEKAVKSLNSRGETEKFLICLTDGDLSYSDRDQVPELQARFKNINYYGIGVGVDLKQYFRNFININNAEQIPVEFANILKATIKRNG